LCLSSLKSLSKNHKKVICVILNEVKNLINSTCYKYVYTHTSLRFFPRQRRGQNDISRQALRLGQEFIPKDELCPYPMDPADIKLFHKMTPHSSVSSDVSIVWAKQSVYHKPMKESNTTKSRFKDHY